MRTAGRLAAAIEVLSDFETRRVPLKTAIADWSRSNRYAGAKDRAFISGLCLDVLRRRTSLAVAMGLDEPRALVLAAMRFIWAEPLDALAEAAAESPHGPGALSDAERAALSGEEFATAPDGDAPDWIAPLLRRAFGDALAIEMAAFGARADVDLRVNTLKTTPEKALPALASVGAAPAPYLQTALRIPAAAPDAKAPPVTVIPAFNKGWVEVQDLGSQIAAAAAGDMRGAQALDYCAGGGGKSLALAALMGNTGQLFAFDRDARRLQPIYERARRAGLRNVQVRSPAGGDDLEDLAGRMSLVFVDAPCTGSGTWRRHPDTKWRLTPDQLERRIEEQDAALREAARFVRPGGRLVWATCSIFMEENEDRIASFLAVAPEFSYASAIESLLASGLLRDGAGDELSAAATPQGALRLTPARTGTDGFFIAVLRRAHHERS